MAGAMPPEEMRCTAKSKRTGERCRNWRHRDASGKVWSVCWWHGARGGGQKGNKHALKHGEHETIWLDCLDAEERELAARVKTEVLCRLDEELRLLAVRERRMLQRIQRLAGPNMTVVEEETASGRERGKKTNLTRRKAAGTLGQIQAVEEALTRVQVAQARLLDLKHKVETATGPDDESGLAALTRVLAKGAGHSGGSSSDD